MFDNIRGFIGGNPQGSDAIYESEGLRANANSIENGYASVGLAGNGFYTKPSEYGVNGTQYMYVAIRRPMPVPETSASVFALSNQVSTSGQPAATSGFVVDGQIRSYTPGSSSYPMLFSRLTSTPSYVQRVVTSSNDGIYNYGNLSDNNFDVMNGTGNSNLGGTSTNIINFLFKRAHSFFDVVCYRGDGIGSSSSFNHNLGVAPEMIWLKRRDTYNGAQHWVCWHKDLDSSNPAHKYLRLNKDENIADDDGKWNDTEPTSSVFTVGNHTDVNNQNGDFTAWLFATTAGVSKVGSYTGDGSTDGSKVINCGFSNGAKFVVIKGLADNHHWVEFNTNSSAGIVAGNDSAGRLNTGDARVTSEDIIDPNSTGFAVLRNSTDNKVNENGVTYIFLAIAA